MFDEGFAAYGPVQWLVIGYLAMLVAFTFVRRWAKGGEEGYLLAGRKLTLFPFVATVVSTAYGWIQGAGELYGTHGLSAWLFLGLPYYAYTIIYAVFFVDRQRKQGKVPYATLPDLLRDRYGKVPGLIGAGLALLLTSPAMYFLLAGQLIGPLLGIPVSWAIGLSAIVATSYLLTGGFNAVAGSDRFMFVLMFGGMGTLVVALLTQSGPEIIQQAPIAFKSLSPNGFDGWYLISWFVLASITLVDPNFHTRVNAAASTQIGKRGLIISVLCWAFFDAMQIFVALYALGDNPNLDPKTLYTTVAQAHLPLWPRAIFLVGILSAVMAAADSFLFASATSLGHDLLKPLGFGAEGRERRLLRACLIGMAVVGVALSLPFAEGSVVDWFFAFQPIAVAALVLPLLFAYGRHRLSTAWVISQMALSALVTVLWSTLLPFVPALLTPIPPVVVGLLTSALIQLVGHVNRRP